MSSETESALRAYLRQTPRQFLELCTAYLDHYHHERPHQALGNRSPVPIYGPQPAGRIVRRERLGGLINHYERTAA